MTVTQLTDELITDKNQTDECLAEERSETSLEKIININKTENHTEAEIVICELSLDIFTCCKRMLN